MSNFVSSVDFQQALRKCQSKEAECDFLRVRRDDWQKLAEHLESQLAKSKERFDELRSQKAALESQLAEARKAVGALVNVLGELRDALKAEPSMQVRKFVDLGISVNNAIALSERVGIDAAGALRAKPEDQDTP